jgi:hypothetical protein
MKYTEIKTMHDWLHQFSFNLSTGNYDPRLNDIIIRLDLTHEDRKALIGLDLAFELNAYHISHS